MTDHLHTEGVIIHSRKDWPCGRCRPDVWKSSSATPLLCVECAIAITQASIRRIELDGLDALNDRYAARAAETETDGAAAAAAFWPPARPRSAR